MKEKRSTIDRMRRKTTDNVLSTMGSNSNVSVTGTAKSKLCSLVCYDCSFMNGCVAVISCLSFGI